MKRNMNTNTEEQAGIRELVAEIHEEQRKIDRLEGDIVASHVRLANHLARLRLPANNDWAKQLLAIGMSPRVASRYLKIAKHWPNEIGLRKSDLLPRLPTDLLKLEWLCRVPKDELGTLLDELDCKRASRSQVIAAVREVLGEDPPAKNEGDVKKFVQRFLDRIMRTVDGLHETFPEAEQQHRVRELLAAGLHKVQIAIENHPDPETNS